MASNEELFELITKIYSEVTGMKSEITGMNSEITGMNSEITGINSEITGIKSQISNLSEKVDKNSLLLERVDSNVKTLAEVQGAFSEQLDRAEDKDGKTLGERLEVIELAVKNTSYTMADISEDTSNRFDNISKDVFYIQDHFKIIK